METTTAPTPAPATTPPPTPPPQSERRSVWREVLGLTLILLQIAKVITEWLTS